MNKLFLLVFVLANISYADLRTKLTTSNKAKHTITTKKVDSKTAQNNKSVEEKNKQQNDQTEQATLTIVSNLIVGKTTKVGGYFSDFEEQIFFGTVNHQNLKDNKVKMTITWNGYTHKDSPVESKKTRIDPFKTVFVAKKAHNLKSKTLLLGQGLQLGGLSNALEGNKPQANTKYANNNNRARNNRQNDFNIPTATGSSSIDTDSDTQNDGAGKVSFEECEPIKKDGLVYLQQRKKLTAADGTETLQSCEITGEGYPIDKDFETAKTECAVPISIQQSKGVYYKLYHETAKINDTTYTFDKCVADNSNPVSYTTQKDYNYASCSHNIDYTNNKVTLQYTTFFNLDGERYDLQTCLNQNPPVNAEQDSNQCEMRNDFVKQKSYEQFEWFYTNEDNDRIKIKDCTDAVKSQYIYPHVTSEEGCTRTVDPNTQIVNILTRTHITNHLGNKIFISDCKPSDETSIEQRVHIEDNNLIDNDPNTNAFEHALGQSYRIVDYIFKDSGALYSTDSSRTQSYTYQHENVQCSDQWEHDDTAKLSFPFYKKGFYVAGKFILVNDCTVNKDIKHFYEKTSKNVYGDIKKHTQITVTTAGHKIRDLPPTYRAAWYTSIWYEYHTNPTYAVEEIYTRKDGSQVPLEGTETSTCDSSYPLPTGLNGVDNKSTTHEVREAVGSLYAPPSTVTTHQTKVLCREESY